LQYEAQSQLYEAQTVGREPDALVYEALAGAENGRPCSERLRVCRTRLRVCCTSLKAWIEKLRVSFGNRSIHR
jgi:hypothetical protein